MAKLSYWERRAAEKMFEYMEEAEQKANELSGLYIRASRYLSLSATDIFEKFQTKHNLTDVEARRLIKELTETSCDELLKAYKNSTTDINKQEVLAKLEAPAYSARIERLEDLNKRIDNVMQTVYKQEKQETTDFYTKLAEDIFYKNIYDTQQQTGLAFSFNKVDPKVIDRVINSKWAGDNYSKRIWNKTEELAQTLKEELLINLVTGRTERETSELMADKFSTAAWKARRLVRTESNYLAGQMDIEAYKECDIERYIFLATLDLRTSELCRSLDSKVFLLSEAVAGTNLHPMHPWCRSTTMSYIDDETLSKMQRRARDPVTGKTYLVPANMNYGDWYDEYVKGNAKAENAEKATQNYHSDHKQYDRYKEILGKDAGKTFADFQDMKYNDSVRWSRLKALYRKSNRYDKVIANEPEITKDLQEISSKTKVDMVGLDHRLKTRESFLRKIDTDSKHSLDTTEIDKTLDSTNDVIRYTYQSPPEDFSKSYHDIAKELEEKGYQLTGIKNTWLDKRNPYNGVNCILQDSRGQSFEVQFHTPESFDIKDKMHKDYEQWRVLDKSSTEAIEIYKRMHQQSAAMKIPKGIEKVKKDE